MAGRARRSGWLCRAGPARSATGQIRRCTHCGLWLAPSKPVPDGRSYGAAGQHRRQAGRADGDCPLPGSAATRAGPGRKAVPSLIMGTKADRRAARERVSAYHQAQLAGLLGHVAAAIDRYRAGEIDACTVDETIHHYHRAATELWKFCFSRSGGSHAEFIAGILDRMAADAETIDWWERATPRRRQ